MVYKTGEKPGKGTYLCTKCDQKVTLDDATDTLPPCPKCKNTEFLNFPAVGDDGEVQWHNNWNSFYRSTYNYFSNR